MSQTSTLDTRLLPVDDIDEDPNQPRRSFDAAGLEELAASIEAAGSEAEPWLDGLLHPVVVYRHPAYSEGQDGPRFILLAGARRLRAYRLRRWPKIPARVVAPPADAARTVVAQIAENSARVDTTLAEEADAVLRAFDAWKTANPKAKTGDFAAEIQRTSPWVSRRLTIARAVGLPRTAVQEGRIRAPEAFRLFAKLPVEIQRELIQAARRTGAVITGKMARAAMPKRKPGESRAARSGPRSSETARPQKIRLELTPETARHALQRLGSEPPADPTKLRAALLEALERSLPST